jgi:long-subunit acyl-CoA synthetase (AMP-forming)
MAVDTLSKAFWRSVEQHGEKPALLVKREKQYRPITYTELGRRVYAFARALHELGVRKGDRVSILSENCPEWAITDWATLCLGAITVPIYPTLTAPQVQEILCDSEPKVLVVSDKKQLRKACEAVEGTGLSPQMISMESEGVGETPTFEQMLNQPGALTESELRALVEAMPARRHHHLHLHFRHHRRAEGRDADPPATSSRTSRRRYRLSIVAPMTCSCRSCR